VSGSDRISTVPARLALSTAVPELRKGRRAITSLYDSLPWAFIPSKRLFTLLCKVMLVKFVGMNSY